MKGITVEDAGVLDYVGTYTITINMYGKEVKVDINDHELGNVRNYEVELVDEAMIDYTQSYADLSSFLSLYLSAKEQKEAELKRAINQIYLKIKSRPAHFSLRDQNLFSKSALTALLSDSHVKSIVESDAKVIQLRDDFEYFSSKCDRLQRSILILEKAWDTARSLNSNNRKSMGG